MINTEIADHDLDQMASDELTFIIDDVENRLRDIDTDVMMLRRKIQPLREAIDNLNNEAYEAGIYRNKVWEKRMIALRRERSDEVDYSDVIDR